MSKPRIIALCGPIGAGKSTVARLLTLEGFVICPFAEPIKRMLHDGLDVPHHNVYGSPEQKAEPLPEFCGRSARELAQTLGTEWGRQQHPNFWLQIWARTALLYPHVVVDDVRFQNEFDFIRQQGGVVAAVNRQNTTQLTGIAGHASEQDWRRQKLDVSIDNFGSISQLAAEVSFVMRNLCEEPSGVASPA